MEIEQLVHAATSGNQRAWKLLSARLWPRLRTWFAARMSNFDSDLLVQDTLFVMWKKLPEFEMRSEAAFMRWTFGIAHFTALAALRQAKREQRLMQALGYSVRAPSPRLSSRLYRAERIAVVLQELENMPRSQRLVIENNFSAFRRCAETHSQNRCAIFGSTRTQARRRRRPDAGQARGHRVVVGALTGEPRARSIAQAIAGSVAAVVTGARRCSRSSPARDLAACRRATSNLCSNSPSAAPC